MEFDNLEEIVGSAPTQPETSFWQTARGRIYANATGTASFAALTVLGSAYGAPYILGILTGIGCAIFGEDAFKSYVNLRANRQYNLFASKKKLYFYTTLAIASDVAIVFGAFYNLSFILGALFSSFATLSFLKIGEQWKNTRQIAKSTL